MESPHRATIQSFADEAALMTKQQEDMETALQPLIGTCAAHMEIFPKIADLKEKRDRKHLDKDAYERKVAELVKGGKDLPGNDDYIKKVPAWTARRSVSFYRTVTMVINLVYCYYFD